MCFNQEVSAVIAAVGITTVVFTATYFKNVEGIWRLYVPVLYFVGMEVLQFVQYFFIDECGTVNKITTIIAFLHVSFQPIFLNMAISFKGDREMIHRVIFPLSFISGIMFAASLIVYDGAQLCNPEYDILCGEETCTTMGNVHLKWNLRLRAQNYFTPGADFHFLLFFGPFLVFKRWFSFFFMLLTGPVLSYLIGGGLGPNGNKDEWASIWCFYSVILAALPIAGNLKDLLERKKKAESKMKQD